MGASSRSCTHPASGFAAFAYRKVSLESQAEVLGGLGVRERVSGPGWVELSLGQHASVLGDLQADSIRIEKHALVIGSVTGNDFQIDHHARLWRPPSSPLALPLVDITPPLPAVAPGTQAVTVAPHAKLTLAPGAYAAVRVRSGKHTLLRLQGGLYQLQSLELEQHARLECTAPCEVRIAGSLSLARHAYLGPAWIGSAAMVRVFVLGAGSSAARLDQHSVFVGRLIAPAGTVELERQSAARGQLIASEIVLRQHARLLVEAPLVPADAGVVLDARPVDAALPDLPRPDAPAPDTAQPDAARPDAAGPDAP